MKDLLLDPSDNSDNMSNFGVSQFEKKLVENKKKKDDEIANCQEIFYIRNLFMALFLSGMLGIGSYYNNILFNIMPIYRCDDCRMKQIEEGHTVYLWELNLNQMMFVIINWIELAYLYYVYRKLKAGRSTQLNIFIEVYIATYSWVFCSMFYFITVVL
jgi:hypothetical protein